MKTRQFFILSLLVGTALIAAPLVAQAGGTITGKVTFSGKVPPPKKFALEKFPNSPFCSKNPNVANVKLEEIEEKGKKKKIAKGDRLIKEVKVAPGGGLKDTIVAVRDINDKGWVKKGYKRTEVFAKLCEFHPFTGVVVNRKSKSFYVENRDANPDNPNTKTGVLHNPVTKAMLGVKQQPIFNIGLAKKGDSLFKKINKKFLRFPKKTKKGGPIPLVRLQCDQHEYMQNYFLPVYNPYFAKVSDDGTFEIKDVPAGKHKVLAWHPVAGHVIAEVNVPEGGSVKANFDIKGK